MIPKHIIEKAIEGGWKDTRPQISAVEREEDVPKASIMNDFMNFYNTPVVVCDPFFWQSLGKALGWSTSCHHLGNNGIYSSYRHVASCEIGKSYWNIKAQQFFDLLLTGGDTEKFWSDLGGVI